MEMRFSEYNLKFVSFPTNKQGVVGFEFMGSIDGREAQYGVVKSHSYLNTPLRAFSNRV
jgi:hypothetical protein